MSHYPTVNKLAFKPDVIFTEANLDPCMAKLLQAAMRQAPPLYEDTLVITSATDDTHRTHSLHYVSRAVDIRYTGQRIGGIVVSEDLFHDIAERQERQQRQERQARFWAGRMRQQLGPDYDVLVEGDHIHAEWDPK